MEDIQEFYSAEELCDWSENAPEAVKMLPIEAQVLLKLSRALGYCIGYDDDDALYVAPRFMAEDAERVAFTDFLKSILDSTEAMTTVGGPESETYILRIEHALINRYFADVVAI